MRETAFCEDKPCVELDGVARGSSGELRGIVGGAFEAVSFARSMIEE